MENIEQRKAVPYKKKREKHKKEAERHHNAPVNFSRQGISCFSDDESNEYLRTDKAGKKTDYESERSCETFLPCLQDDGRADGDPENVRMGAQYVDGNALAQRLRLRAGSVAPGGLGEHCAEGEVHYKKASGNGYPTEDGMDVRKPGDEEQGKADNRDIGDKRRQGNLDTFPYTVFKRLGNDQCQEGTRGKTRR